MDPKEKEKTGILEKVMKIKVFLENFDYFSYFFLQFAASLNAKTKRIFELELEIDELRNNQAEHSPDDASTTTKKRRLVVQPSVDDSAAKADEILDGNRPKTGEQHDDSAIGTDEEVFLFSMKNFFFHVEKVLFFWDGHVIICT